MLDTFLVDFDSHLSLLPKVAVQILMLLMIPKTTL